MIAFLALVAMVYGAQRIYRNMDIPEKKNED
jgi:hypothetical protein